MRDFFCLLLALITFNTQAQKNLCDSVNQLKSYDPTPEVQGMKTACAENIIALFNPSFAKPGDCCAETYYAAKGIFFIFDNDSGVSEKEQLFNTRFKAGYNSIMMQRMHALGDINTDSIYTGRVEVNKGLAAEINSHLSIKRLNNEHVRILLNSKDYSRFDSITVLCSFDPTPYTLWQLRKGITASTKNSSDGLQQGLRIIFDFAPVRKQQGLCLCAIGNNWDFVHSIPVKKKHRKNRKEAI